MQVLNSHVYYVSIEFLMLNLFVLDYAFWNQSFQGTICYTAKLGSCHYGSAT
jgi:hypothetical protein